MNTDNKLQKNHNQKSKLEDRFVKLIEMVPKLESFTSTSIEELIEIICKQATELVNASYTHVRRIDWLENKLIIMKW